MNMPQTRQRFVQSNAICHDVLGGRKISKRLRMPALHFGLSCLIFLFFPPPSYTLYCQHRCNSAFFDKKPILYYSYFATIKASQCNCFSRNSVLYGLEGLFNFSGVTEGHVDFQTAYSSVLCAGSILYFPLNSAKHCNLPLPEGRLFNMSSKSFCSTG